VAQAIAQGGPAAQAYAQGLATAINTLGLGAVSQVLAQAQAQAAASGNGVAFAQVRLDAGRRVELHMVNWHHLAYMEARSIYLLYC
jgi:hypothetical protein